MDGKKTYLTAIILALMGATVGMGWLDASTANAIGLAVAGAMGASLRHAIEKKQ